MQNRFRKEYRALTEEEQKKVYDLKCKADELLALIDAEEGNGGPRERAVAITKLEECVMWATKAFTA